MAGSSPNTREGRPYALMLGGRSRAAALPAERVKQGVFTINDKERTAILADIRRHFGFLPEQGYAVGPVKELPMGDWEVRFNGAQHSIAIQTDRGEVGLGLVPLGGSMRDEIGIRALIYYVTGGESFIGRVVPEGNRRREPAFQALAALLQEYLPIVQRYMGKDFESYRHELMLAEKRYLDRFMAEYMPPARSREPFGDPAAAPNWISILYAPRATIRRLLARPVLQTWIWPGVLLGITWVLRQLGAGADEYSLNAAGILVFSLSIGPVFGIFIVWLTGACLAFVGRRFGGTGDAVGLRVAYAWSWMPNILLLPLTVIDTFLNAIRGSVGQESGGGPAVRNAILAVYVIYRLAALWSLSLMVITTSEAHGFSKWRAALTLVISVLVILAIAFPVLWLKAGFGL